MAIYKHAHPPEPDPRSSAQRSGRVDSSRQHAFARYLVSIGLTPEIADGIDLTEFCQLRDEAWEEVIRQIRGHAPDPDANSHVRGIIARLGRLVRPRPARGHELDAIRDDIDLSEGPDEERFPFFTAAQLNAGQFETRYLIKNVLAAGQPGGIFGAFKTLKTSVTADLLISLASGTPFLGQFPVAEPGRTLFLSGESGLSALQSIARRVCTSRGLSLDGLENFELSPKLPRLDQAADVRALRRIIRDKRPVCVAIDPAYLAIRGDDARNLFAMGSLLRPLAEIGDMTGCTILVVHHCKRSQNTSAARPRSTTSPGAASPSSPPSGCCSPAGGPTTRSWAITNCGSPSAAAPVTTVCGRSTRAKESRTASSGANGRRPSARYRSPRLNRTRRALKPTKNAAPGGKR